MPARLPHRPATLGFAEGITWLSQIGLFIMLGLLASPADLPGQLGYGLVAGLVLSFAARPLSVFIATIGFKVSWKERAFLSWAGLRGAVPIILATVPMTVNLPGADQLFAAVFVLVVVFTVIQGPTQSRKAAPSASNSKVRATARSVAARCRSFIRMATR